MSAERAPEPASGSLSPLETTVPDLEHYGSGAIPSSGPASTEILGLPERYDLVQNLGAGATGRVVAVRDRTFDRVVAAKVLSGSDGLATAHFIREARITASLEHPNIIPIHDLEFPAAGTVFFTMRRVSGISLGEALRQAAEGTAPEVIATTNNRLTVVLKVADALARAHANGVIHQDVKPDNIMLGGQGEVLLVDWGEARLRGESRTSRPTTVGTPAYMSPEQARGETSTEASDIYALGATLFHALLLRYPTIEAEPEAFWAKKRAGIVDSLTLAEQARVPRLLLAVVMKSLAARPADRYPSITAFAADLVAFQGGLAVAAYHESLPARVWRWSRRHARALAVAAAFVAVIAAAGWMLLGERLKEMATWGAPVLAEQFDATWSTRWVPLEPNTFVTHGGRLESTGTSDNRFLLYRPLITGSLAVEVTVQIEPGARLGDIGVSWIDASGSADPSRLDALFQQNGLDFSVCGNFNSVAVLKGRLNGEYIQQVPMVMVPGRPYRVRVVIDGPQMVLEVDGERLIDEHGHLPRGPGYFGLRSRFAGVTYSDLRVWIKGVAQKVDVLSIGDTFVQEGQLEPGARAYRRVADSFPGSELAQEALWREGLARSMAGDLAGAEQAWRGISARELLDRVAARRLELRIVQPDWNDVASFTELYGRAPELRSWMRRMWSSRIAGTIGNTASHEVLLHLKEALFPDDFGTAPQECIIFWGQRRYQDILRRQPGQTRWNAFALIAMGRFDEAMAMSGESFPVDIDVRWSRGQFQEVIDDPVRYPPPARATALIRLGRIGEAATLLGEHPTAQLLLAQGRAEDVLAMPQLGAQEAQAALWVLDRTGEACAGNPAFPKRAKAPFGLLVSNEPAVALRNVFDDRQASVLVLLRRIRGERELERAARAQLAALPLCFQYDDRWFGEIVLPAILDRLDGDPRAMLALREASRARFKGMWAGHLQPFVEFILGDIDERTFLTQPCRGEAPVWLELAKGLRAEFIADAATALSAYRAWSALPRYQRLVGVQMSPNVVAERFVSWRLQVLAAGRKDARP